MICLTVHDKLRDRHSWQALGNLWHNTDSRRSLKLRQHGPCPSISHHVYTAKHPVYALQQACLHMHQPTLVHQGLVKRVLLYVRGTSAMGLRLSGSQQLDIITYLDADWPGCPDALILCLASGKTWLHGQGRRWSTTTWPTLSWSAHGCASTLANLATITCPPAIRAAIQSVTKRTKHIELDVLFVREKMAIGECQVLHFPTTQQFADMMTKGPVCAVTDN